MQKLLVLVCGQLQTLRSPGSTEKAKGMEGIISGCNY